MLKVLFLIFCLSSSLFAMNREELVQMQFDNTEIDLALKAKIPFLQQNLTETNATKFSDENIFTVCFTPKDEGYNYFAQQAGIDIFKAKFVVSWYIFTNQNQLPSSMDNILKLVNTQKPLSSQFLSSINGKWTSMTELPYFSLSENNYVYAFISFPNQNGILVPIASRSFYKEIYSQDIHKNGKIKLNYDMLAYWKQKKYL